MKETETKEIALEKLKSDYIPATKDDLINTLIEYFKIYATESNWNESLTNKRYDPHEIREGTKLDFYPRMVVDGFSFAQEALAAVDRFNSFHETINAAKTLRKSVLYSGFKIPPHEIIDRDEIFQINTLEV